jgi:hypothetical protein
VWTLPVTAMVMGLFAIPGSALVLVAFAARLIWRLKEAERGLEKATAPQKSARPLISSI